MTKLVKESITGKKFGRLTALAPPYKTAHGLTVATVCTCGTEKPVLEKLLRKGTVRSCGCLKREVHELLRPIDKDGNTKFSAKREYDSFVSATQRCINPRANKYATCGGAGIKFHESWLGDFPAFLKDMGPAGPGQILTRRDLKGDFTPENCYWGNWRDMARNTIRHRRPVLAVA